MEKQRKLKYKETVTQGELVKVKTLAEHEMESGVRRDEKTGVIYPRLIIYKVTARYNGKIVFQANWFSGVSANPYLAFYFRANKSGLIEIEWEDDYSKSTFKRGYLKVLDKDGNELLPINHSI
ncbi:MAG: thiosulfate oxidation carrier complex protein SoxZ [Pelagibacterales bacterium]|nr:thiosulfate oxidation carrier complex protein SoxZ [Pelagibacterales bacterium]|tara:strand:+ start:256 stop:624 length:369 start_codon:yes stop_codon:yes gene_type:complete